MDGEGVRERVARHLLGEAGATDRSGDLPRHRAFVGMMATPLAAAGIDGKCSGGEDALPAPIGLPGRETRVGAKAVLEYRIHAYIVKLPAWPSGSGGRGFAKQATFRIFFDINMLWRP